MAKQSPEPVFLRVVLVFLSALYFSGNSTATYADGVQEYTAKSVLALNLARFSDWPPEVFQNSGGSVNLCLMGDEVVQQAFHMIDKKQVGNKNLSVINIKENKQLEGCQLLYISEDSANAAQWLQESYKRHILTIGERDNFLGQGGMVYFEMINPKINLIINLAATQKAGVQISSRVLKLATIFK
jgi:hypothetical protein